MLNDTLREFLEASREAYGEGRPDYQRSLMEGRELAGNDPDAPRIESALGTNPTTTRLRDLMAHIGAPKWMQSNANERQVREEMGMGLKNTNKAIAGQLLGTIGADLTQDHSRELWWLLNAPQAVGNVVQEYSLNKVNPDLYSAEIVRDGRGDPIRKSEKDELLAIDLGLIDKESARRKKGVGIQYDKGTNEYVYNRRKYKPGHVAALSIPTGVAINAGIGLLNPLGGSGGYQAVLPSEGDASKTNNILGEIAAKYILGRTGGLLPYDEFSKVRPDVSHGEYNAYKAFKYDKALDYDITDGDVNLIPGGVLKATIDGIHGPEVQFLGRSLPVTTTAIPFATALAGTTLGAMPAIQRRFGLNPKHTIRNALMGGIAGVTGGGGMGYAIELERRRRNEASNEAAAAAYYAQTGGLNG